MIRCVHPTKASGATPIGSTGRAPDKNIEMKKAIVKISIRKKICKTKKNAFEPMLKHKYLTIASGATPIGSTGRAPDENSGRKEKKKKKMFSL